MQQGFRRRGIRTLNRALSWLEALKADERFFLFLHLYDAHGPYAPTQENRKRFQSDGPGPVLREFNSKLVVLDSQGQPIRTANAYIDLYDAALRSNDELLDQLLAALNLETTAVLVLGDHGETLIEHDYEEVFDLRDDPQELHPLEGETEVVDPLRKLIDNWLGEVGETVERPDLTPEQVKQFKALGYL